MEGILSGRVDAGVSNARQGVEVPPSKNTRQKMNHPSHNLRSGPPDDENGDGENPWWFYALIAVASLLLVYFCV